MSTDPKAAASSGGVDLAEAMRQARREADAAVIFGYGPPICSGLAELLLWHRTYEKELRARMGWEPLP